MSMYTKACEMLSQTHWAHMSFERDSLSRLSPQHTNNCSVHRSMALCILLRDHRCKHQAQMSQNFLSSSSIVERTGCLKLNHPFPKRTVDALRGEESVLKFLLTNNKLTGERILFTGCSHSFLMLVLRPLQRSIKILTPRLKRDLIVGSFLSLTPRGQEKITDAYSFMAKSALLLSNWCIDPKEQFSRSMSSFSLLHFW